MTSSTCCAVCGLPASADRSRFTWALTIEPDGRRSWTCTPCARAALPVIESGVPIVARSIAQS
ncbi:MAG TPA: hypothetical protein VEV65_13505 [Kineosporiaceae bacterium]|nr:hypothetical protein [Kineosporiaceae bacterium]